MLYGYKIAALCLAKVNDSACREYVCTLGESLCKHGWRLMVYSTCSDLFYSSASDEGDKAVFELIDFEHTDALIIFDEMLKCDELKNNLIAKAKASSVPVYVLGKKYEGCVDIGFDNVGGFRDVVEHLVTEHNIREFRMISGFEDNSFSKEREDTMKAVLAGHGIEFTDDMIKYGNFWSIPAANAAREIIDSGEIPEAVVCANDAMAIAVCSVFTAEGFHVPDDLIITGFDGIEEIIFCNPKITSCKCSYTDLAHKTVEIMLKHDKGEEIESSYIIKPRLLASESCGCCQQTHISSNEYFSRINDSFNRFQNEEHRLYEISAKIQNCRSIKELSQNLVVNEIYSAAILLNKDSIDSTISPSMRSSERAFSKTRIVVLDTEYSEDEKPYEYSGEDVLPHLKENFEFNVPLIFCALSFIDVPLGYICFHFGYDDMKSYNMQNFNKIPQIVNSLSSALGGLRNIRYQRFLRGQIEDMYKFDSLTGLYSRNGFIMLYQEAADTLSEHGGTLTAALADLDGLKYINDNFGHVEGDNAITVAAKALMLTCRGAICCRLGGDEMIAIFDKECDGEKLKAEFDGYLDRYNAASGKPYKVRASMGVFSGKAEEYTNFDKLLKNTDDLMYADKTRRKARSKG